MLRVVVLTVCCLVLFAANAILCRSALVTFSMAPISYTAIRCFSAAGMLCVLCVLTHRQQGCRSVAVAAAHQSSWPASACLFCYMLFFSLSYTNLPSAAGTLLLNTAVQCSIIGWGLWCGMLLTPRQMLGLLVAFAGMAGLLAPGITAPPLWNSFLMVVSGLAWGVYCLYGRAVSSAMLATTGNFVRASVFSLIGMGIAWLCEPIPCGAGIMCAVLAGAAASGLGYSLWYVLVPRMTLLAVSAVQLLIPAITALLAFIFLAEPITLRLIACTLVISTGILLTLYKHIPHATYT